MVRLTKPAEHRVTGEYVLNVEFGQPERKRVIMKSEKNHVDSKT